MDLKAILRQTVGVRQSHVRTVGVDKATCLVHKEWLSLLVKDKAVPSLFPHQEGLTDAECEILMHETPSTTAKDFTFVTVIRIVKMDNRYVSLRLKEPWSRSHDMGYLELIRYVSETNYRNIWKEANSSSSKTADKQDENFVKLKPFKDYNSAVREIISRLYACPIICVGAEGHDENPEAGGEQAPLHPHLVPVYCALETSSEFLLFLEFREHTVEHCGMFSSSALVGSRLLFVVYQLLRVLRYLHDLGLPLGPLTLADLSLDHRFWLQATPPWWLALQADSWVESSLTGQLPIIRSSSSRRVSRITPSASIQEEEKVEPLPPLNELVDTWVKGKLSNFDYLMALNQLCGRTGANPQHHPVLPWVRDLSQPEGGWRDLSKSKLRLTRGDDHLDATYGSAMQSQSAQPQAYLPIDRVVQVPHHLSELLADITYYVYFARRLPRSILCKHVRHKWVPAEYPASIQRLQAWTVDECIPEFFTDPSIFESIHDDLEDLGVPGWCSSPEDFVRKHMAMLESERVSEHLHHWIDITFGYKLTGQAAIKSKNVCRPLVDGHTTLHSCGMVQLFSTPHPHRAASSLYLSRCSAPKTFRFQHSSNTVALGSPQSRPQSSSMSSRRKSRQDTFDKELSLQPEAKEGGEDDAAPEAAQSKRKPSTIVKSRSVGQQLASTTGSSVPAETQVIVLPKDYSPLSKLQQLESLCNFCLHHPPHRLPPSISLASAAQPGEDEQDGSFPRRRSQTSHAADMYLLGCLLVEMSIFSTTARHSSRDLSERYLHALQILKIQPSRLPKSLHNAVQVLLQTEKPVTVPFVRGKEAASSRAEWRYPCVCDGGLPPPSAHQLLQPLLSTIPFPAYYPALYDFLTKLDAQPTAPEKVYFVARELPPLLTQLSQVDLDLVMNHLSDLFSNPESSLLAVWQLFDLVGLALGPKVLAERLLTVLINLLSTDQLTVRHFRLFHRSFLLKLQVRLGMRTFLHCFITLLVEAVGGYRDNSTAQIVDPENPSAAVRKGSHLDSAELDPLRQASTSASREASPMRAGHRSSSSERDMPSASPEPATFGEPEMFELDQDQELEQSASYSYERKDAATFPEITTWPPSTDKEEQPNASQPERLESEGPDPSPQMPSIPAIPVTETYEVTPSEAGESGGCSLSDIASESAVWLAHRLGPVLTAKHLSRNLLRMLTLCYMGPQQLSPAKGPLLEGDVSLFEQGVVGDQTAAKVLETLSNLAMLYGESFITRQYLPHAVELLCMCKKHLTDNLEAGLIGAVTMVKHVLPFLSDTTLMSQLQEVVLKNILYPLVQLASSLQHCFPRGVVSRQVLTRKIADTLYLVGLRIGFQMSRRHLSVLLRRFFASFNRAFPPAGGLSAVQHLTQVPAPGDKEEQLLCRSIEDYLPIKREAGGQELRIGTPVKLSSVLRCRGSPPYPHTPPYEEREGDDRNIPERAHEEVKQVFTAELAFMTYIPLCKLAGGIYMEQTLTNHELILELCAAHDSALAMSESGTDATSGPRKFRKGHYRMPSAGQDEAIVSGEFGKNVAMVGNRIDVQLGEESHLVTAGELPDAAPKYDINLLMRKMTNGQRHLKGSWLAYWEHEIGVSLIKDSHFDFKQIRLQTFTGHTGSVRSLEVLENENSFLSGSRDRTVKLWSLRSCGDGSTVMAPQWTYPHHRKSISSIAFLPSLRLVGSSDHGVHIWDPFMGSCLKQFDTSKTQPVTVLLAMPSPSTTFLAATSNSTVRFLDARAMRYTHELRVSIGSAGVIRSLAVSPSGNWLAVGHSSGVLSVLDVRTGFMLGSWVAHDGEILQTKAFNDAYFISSSLDHSISVWNAIDTKLHYNLKGATEPVTCLGLHNAGVVSGTTANKINVHTTIDEKAVFTSTKLRSETFRGVIASMAVLPLNRLLLLGADNGSISLLC
ncbi:WD repeat domain 81 isoform X4 [Dermacentor variabilis]|uniref:WD repeat domain 81 isoform X4 n=1 Tax=Dermacentor variabilis TaxID=34621 RepID=UPI003F5C1076